MRNVPKNYIITIIYQYHLLDTSLHWSTMVALRWDNGNWLCGSSGPASKHARETELVPCSKLMHKCSLGVGTERGSRTVLIIESITFCYFI